MKITNEMADRLARIIFENHTILEEYPTQTNDKDEFIKAVKQEWKEAGLIKKNPLDKAKSILNDFKQPATNASMGIEQAVLMGEYFLEATKQRDDEIKELKMKLSLKGK